MKAVIYARYSSDNQTEASIEGQLRECMEFAEHAEIDVVGQYIDRALSAKTDNRPEFQKMIKDSYKHAFDCIIVWKLDRFARNRYDSAHYKSLLKKNGVKVISAKESIGEGSEGILLESVLEGNGYAWEGSGPFSAEKDYDGWEDYGGYSRYVNFAKNDIELFGDVNHSGAEGSVPYTRITATDSTNHKDWFKWVCVNYINDFVGEKCITVYYGGIDIADGGIYRYDTVNDLESDGVTAIGTWNIG